MSDFYHRIQYLDGAVAEVTRIIDRWMERSEVQERLEATEMMRLRLAVHEWVANIVQHGSFEASVPEIAVSVRILSSGVECAIEDNSTGFDLNRQLKQRRKHLRRTVLPERGMGLEFIRACTDELRYWYTDQETNVIEFSVVTDEISEVDVRLDPPEMCEEAA